MRKDYMLICDLWNPLDGVWGNTTLFFSTEKEMKQYVVSAGKGIKIERMCRIEDIQI